MVRHLLGVVAILLIASPVIAWASYKPLRVVAPQWNGVTCIEAICVDDETRRAEATALYEDAKRFVDANIGTIESRPHAIFCNSEACSRAWGWAVWRHTMLAPMASS
ncbi:MAG: hypothetical protein AAF737_09825 [Pseudomonadota bacterium]